MISFKSWTDQTNGYTTRPVTETQEAAVMIDRKIREYENKEGGSWLPRCGLENLIID